MNPDLTPGAERRGAEDHVIELTVNARPYRVSVPSRRTLLDLLRDDLDLTGTKKVCDMGHCGACTVHRNGVAVLSCLTLAVSCEGDEIVTIEGLIGEDGTLTPVQQAFVDCDGLQCGFCTPGFLMLAVGVLEREPDISDEDLIDVLSSNLCRCTGYQNIIKAVRAAAKEMRKG